MEELFLPEFPPRDPEAHKGSVGSVLVVAGSARYPGAAILATLGAGRAGAGLVHLVVPADVAPLVLPAVPFAVLHRAPGGDASCLGQAATDVVLEAAAGCEAVVLGPGLGAAPDTGALVEGLLESLELPLVLDADGLNLVAGRAAGRLRGRRWATVLTPHPGEFARLDQGSVPRGETERAQRAAGLSRRLGAIVVLKGHHTVVTDGQRLRVEQAGNPGMATGGMGDVLAGFVGSLLAALPDPAAAAALAVHLHAVAGDLAAADLGPESVLPEDVADRFGLALGRHRARS